MRNYSLLFLFCISFIVNANDHEPVFNQVHLQAQAETDIQNTVILAAEEEGKDAPEVADKINQRMKWTLDKASAINTIQLKSLSYNTYPIYDKQRSSVGERLSNLN